MKNRHEFHLFEKGSKKLLFIATAHALNEFEKEFIEDKVREFSPDLILLEGGFNIPTFSNENEAIKNGKEMGFISYLGRKLEIKLGPNDPTSFEKFYLLVEKYGFEFTFVFYNLMRWSHNGEFDPNFNNDKFTQKLLNKFHMKEFNFSIENFKKEFKKIFLEEFDETKNYYDYFNPFLHLNIFNEAGRYEDIFRDGFMLIELEKHFSKHKKILIAKGNGHFGPNIEKIKKLMKRINS